MGAAGRAKVESTYRPELVVPSYEAAYEAALAAP